jgi:quinol monooxygenase YgiN
MDLEQGETLRLNTLEAMTVRLAILISTRAGLGHLQKEAFAGLAPLVRAETGCIQYDLHSVEGEPDRFLLLEQWESQAALDAHDVAAHVVTQDAANGEFRAGPVTVLRLSPEPVA